MRLYQGCATKAARHVLDHGFEGELWLPLKEDQEGVIVRDETGEPVVERESPERWCVFRSGSFAAETGEDEDASLVVIPEGDFVLMIDVPEAVAKKYEVVEQSESDTDVHENTSPPNREFWFPQEVANRFRDTIKVYDRDGAEVHPDLIDK